MTTVTLTGYLTCASPHDAALVAHHLPDHIALSRAEPGCLIFNVTQISPLIWLVDETFTDRAAFDAHQSRTQSSVWFRATAHIARRFTVSQA